MGVSVVLSTPPTFHLSSWAIREFTGSDVSHASLHFDGDGLILGHRRWVYEAVSHGVRLVPFERWEKVNLLRYRLNFVDEFAAYRGLSVSLYELGAEYDYGGVIKFALYLLLKKIHLGAANWMRASPDSLFCSEAVLRVIQTVIAFASDPETFGDLLSWVPDLTSPEDLKRLRRYDAFEVTYANPGNI